MKVSDIKYILFNYLNSVDHALYSSRVLTGKNDASELSSDQLSDFISQPYFSQNKDLWYIFVISEYLVKSKLVTGSVISNNRIDLLFTLPENQLARLKDLAFRLYITNNLTHRSFDNIIATVKSKLPAVRQSLVKKISTLRRNPQDIDYLSEVELRNKRHFFFSNTTIAKGTYGSIKKGYDAPTDAEPLYALKELHDSEDGEIEAKREVKYHRLLGRTAEYFCIGNRYFVLFEWQKGKNLHTYSSDAIATSSLKSRFKSAFGVITELSILHQTHRVHGDIKSLNVIYDPVGESLHLIDFGSAHKSGSRKWFAHTASVYDKYQAIQRLTPKHEYSFCDDLYSLSLVVALLFPELFTRKRLQIPMDKMEIDNDDTLDNIFTVIFNKKTDSASFQEQAIMMLVAAMPHRETGDLDAIREARYTQCTAEDAFQFCNAISQNWDNLNETVLKQIAVTTIHRPNITVDDAVHGHLTQTLKM